MNTQGLQPDYNEASKFLSHLDPNASTFTFQTFDDNADRKDGSLVHVLNGTLEQHYNVLVQLNQQGAGVFVTVNETDGNGRKKQNIIRIRSVWIEDDEGNNIDTPVDPHIVVQSSPGKYHNYYLTDTTLLDEFEPVQQCLVDNYGSDPSAKDRARVLRLPGFYHQKVNLKKGQTGTPSLVKIIYESNGPAMSWKEIKIAFPPANRTNKAPPQRHHLGPSEIPQNCLGTSLDEIEVLLRHLDPDMNYGDWIKVGQAIHHETSGSTEGKTMWEEWSSTGDKYVENECECKWLTFGDYDGSAVTIGTLKHMAGVTAAQHRVSVEDAFKDAPTRLSEIPEPTCFILPSNNFSILQSANMILPYVALHKKLFIHGGAIVEMADEHGCNSLHQVSPVAFRSRLEGYGKDLMAHVIHKEEVVLKPKLCSTESAKALMESVPATQFLPHIRMLVGCPVLMHNMKVLSKGYHNANGGIMVTKGDDPAVVSIVDAVKSLEGLFVDIDFTSTTDKSRAVAMLITPMLKMGGFISSPCPQDVAEANESQSGKTYRQKVVAAIYNDAPIIVAPKQGGVGSIDESIASALATGKPFIQLDNFRGSLSSPYIEAAITTPESVPIRLPGQQERIVDTRSVTYQLSSNGVNTSKDLANRSCVIRIRKRQGHRWKKWPEGDLLDHVKINQAYYLGCVISVIREWHSKGRQKTDTTEHDMREWAQSLDWILQYIFKLPPLLDGHQAVQHEISNPDLTWLRAVCIAVEHTYGVDMKLHAHNIAEICEEEGIEWPRGKVVRDNDVATKYVGTIMVRIFRDQKDGIVNLDRYIVTREINKVYDATHCKERTKKCYIISLSHETSVVTDLMPC